MKLKKIGIRNVRSYKNQEIEFPEGKIHLNGNVGAGKSTILLAIEFALFGTRRPELPSSSLLRYGEKEGSVKLEFELDDKNIKIERVLKRNSNGIVQEPGVLSIDGEYENLTPGEMKSKIIKLLNYPKEFLTKSKALVYRYTVYTPQEQMKEILTEGVELRLDTLRRLFGVDKYKRIRDNSKILCLDIKDKRKEISGFVSDVEAKKEYLLLKGKEKLEIESKITPVKKRIFELSEEVKLKKENLLAYEEKIEVFNELNKNFEVRKNEHRNLVDESEKIRKIIEELSREIKVLEEELSDKEKKDVELLKKNIEEINEKLVQSDDVIHSKISEIENLKAKLEISKKMVEDISSLSECPTCKQDVKEEHKKDIVDREKLQSADLIERIRVLEEDKKVFEQKKEEFQIMLEAQRKKIANVELINLKINNLEEKKKREVEGKKRLEDIAEHIKRLEEFIRIDEEKIKVLEEGEVAKYPVLKKEVEEVEGLLKKEEVECSALEAGLESNKKEVEKIKEEISEKEKAKLKGEELGKILFWLEKDFVEMVSAMEKKVMARINLEFGDLFKKWFNMLMDNEDIQVSLDNEFTPLINQNSHEMDYLHMSGGEKTAVALAYRLALNQVINNLMSEIKTNDLLILDEPTDGFSTQQLERMRNVLEELKINQVLLVSHESKIESFVEHVIYVNKENNETRIGI